MKIGVSLYSYFQSLRAGKINIEGVIDHAAKTGFDSMDIALLEYLGDPQELAPSIKKMLDDAGLSITNYAIGTDFIKRELVPEVEKAKKAMDVAAFLGAKTFRHDPTFGFPEGYTGKRGFDYILPKLVEAFEITSEYAKSLGMINTIENHGQIVQESDRVEKLLCSVQSDNLKLLLDMGNFLCADEKPTDAIGKLAPYAVHLHAKDFFTKKAGDRIPEKGWMGTRGGNYLRGTIVGHGEVQVYECLRMMKAAGYQGALALEFEGMEHDLTAIELGYSQLRLFTQQLEM